MGLFGSPTSFKNQKYVTILKNCLDTGHPFLDPVFPPDNKTVFSSTRAMSGIAWMRPKDIYERPQFHEASETCHAMTESDRGQPWLVSACSALATDIDIWNKIVPEYQAQEYINEEGSKSNAGVFRFRFWRYGEWLEVVIDDMLPTRHANLIFCHSKSSKQLWVALLEKAYAKLNGSFAIMREGDIAEILEDFTGGVTEVIKIHRDTDDNVTDDKKKKKLFEDLCKLRAQRDIVVAKIVAGRAEDRYKPIESGLITDRDYVISEVKYVDTKKLEEKLGGNKYSLVKLRNPWGKRDFNGAWSEGSPEMAKLTSDDRKKLGITIQDEGEFWMEFSDFYREFHIVTICRVMNTAFFTLAKSWCEIQFHGCWGAAVERSGGGPVENSRTFLKNPQYRFDIDSEKGDCVIVLTQKRGQGTLHHLTSIGFVLYRVENNRKYRIHRPQEQEAMSAFNTKRSIVMRRSLAIGRYLLVLCTTTAKVNANFLLRIFTETACNGMECTKDLPHTTLCESMACLLLCRTVQVITQVKVIGCDGIESPDPKVKPEPYVYISCEGGHFKSHTCSESTSPKWNYSAVLYRRDPFRKPIIVEIWHNNRVVDECIGFVELPAKDDEYQNVYTMGLKDKSNPDAARPGTITVQVTTSHNLIDI